MAPFKPPRHIISHLTINFVPNRPAPAAGERGYFTTPNEDGVCYSLSRTAVVRKRVIALGEKADKRVAASIIIYWPDALWMAPLEIRYIAPLSSSTTVTRRVVVQLPPVLPPSGRLQSDYSAFTGDHGMPLVFAATDTSASEYVVSSGWVNYIVGLGSRRAQACNGMERCVTVWNGVSRYGTGCHGMERGVTVWNGV